MTKLLEASLIAGFAVFVWVNISWMVLPWHAQTVHSFKDDKAVQLALAMNINSSQPGIYSVPAMHKCNAVEGPSALVALTPMGQHFSPVKLIVELLLNISISFLVTWLLLQTNITAYFEKVKFVLVAGLSMTLITYVPLWNWWGFALDYVAVGCLDMLISSLIAALLIAKLTES
jgi:hypothetical protein